MTWAEASRERRGTDLVWNRRDWSMARRPSVGGGCRHWTLNRTGRPHGNDVVVLVVAVDNVVATQR